MPNYKKTLPHTTMVGSSNNRTKDSVGVNGGYNKTPKTL